MTRSCSLARASTGTSSPTVALHVQIAARCLWVRVTSADKKKGASNRASSEGGRASETQWCAACKIKVPLGYVACPKCKGRLPGARLGPRASGTSVVAGARRPMWLLLALAIGVAGAIYYHFLLGADSTTGRVVVTRPDERETASAEGDDDDQDAALPASDEERSEALATLVGALEDAGIAATAVPLTGDESVIVLRSDDCGETADVLSDLEPMLAGADFHSARCFSSAGLLSYQSSW